MPETSSAQLKKDYFWNTLGSLMNALSSALLLMFVTHCLGLYESGLFSLAYALGQQFMIVGAFEMRPYQATDVDKRFSFGTYLGSRFFTCGVMLVSLVAYAIFSNGLSTDALAIILVAGLKVFDAFEDVFHGMFQQNGRLDIGGKAFFFRSLVTTVSFAAALFVSRDLLVASIVSAVCSFAVLLPLDIKPAVSFESLRPDWHVKPIARLLVTCVPLFVASFLLTDLANVPKFGIESWLGKEEQTIYAVLYMPALVINMLVGFVFKPLLTSLASYWTSGKKREFATSILKGVAAIGAVTVLAFLVAWPLGSPVLSLLYGIDIGPYRGELMVLLLGGSLNALTVVLYYGLVTMRIQRLVVVGYACAAAFAHLSAATFIGTFQIMGAVMLYDVTMGLLALFFVCFSIYGWKSSKSAK